MKIKIFIALAMACLLTGCSAVQVSDRMYVQMMGISEEEGECVLCVQAVGTKSPADEAPVYEYYEGRGRSFRQAAADIETEKGRQLFFGHCTLLVLDGEYLSSAEGLKMLMGERVSPGCRVCCSDVPGEVLSREGEEGLIGADIISGEIKLLAARGQFPEVTLKDVCIAAEKGEAILLPGALSDAADGMSGGTAGMSGAVSGLGSVEMSFGEGGDVSQNADGSGNSDSLKEIAGGDMGDDSGEMSGVNGSVSRDSPGNAFGSGETSRTGAISVRGGTINGSGAVYGGEIRFLDMDETVIAGLLRGETGAELPVSGGTFRVDRVSPTVYCQTGENILNVSLDIRGTMTEIDDNTDLEICRGEAADIVAGGVRSLLERQGGLSVTEAVVGVPSGETVNVEVKLIIKN